MLCAFCLLVWANPFLITVFPHQHQTRWRRRKGALQADPLDTTTTNETAGAAARAAAATTGTDLAAPLMTAIADDQRVLGSEFILLPVTWVSADSLFTGYILNCFLCISFLSSRGRMYGRGRSRSREDDRYALMPFRGVNLFLSWPGLNCIPAPVHLLAGFSYACWTRGIKGTTKLS